MDGSNSNKRRVESPREGDPWMDVRILKQTLDCPVCFEHFGTEIYQCSVGHFICSSCRDKILDMKCPTCSIKTSFKRCFGMEHVVQSVAFPCSNAKYGCREGAPSVSRSCTQGNGLTSAPMTLFPPCSDDDADILCRFCAQVKGLSSVEKIPFPNYCSDDDDYMPSRFERSLQRESLFD